MVWLRLLPPNIARLISSLGQYIYSQDKETLYTHLFIGSEAQFYIGGKKIALAQKTNYPWEGIINFSVNLEEQEAFTFALRIPGWCRKYQVKLNGEVLEEVPVYQGYAKINRLWRKGDEIELSLEMPVELIQANPKVREDHGKVAIQRGPVVYCLEEVDNGRNLWTIALTANDKLAAEFAADLFGGVAVIRGEASCGDNDLSSDQLYYPLQEQTKPVNIQAIPYCMWGNRKLGEMMVWITRK